MSTETKTRPVTIEVRDLPALDTFERPSAPRTANAPQPAAKTRGFWSRLGDARYHVRSL